MSLLSALGGVLMVGHSLIGQDQPRMLEQLLQAAGAGQAQVQAQIINGAPLTWNWDNAASAEGIDAREALSAGEADVLILTEAIPLANHVQWSDSAGQIARWADHGRAANPDLRVFVLETWHSRNSGTGADIPHDDAADVPWRQRITDDAPVWQQIAGDATVIPAGQAMGRLSDAIDAGDPGGLIGIGDLFEDDIHLNALGDYFVALVAFTTLTQQDPTGLPHALRGRFDRSLASATPDTIARLQAIAAETVRDSVTLTRAQTAPVQPAAPPAVAQQAAETPLPAPAPGGMAINLAPVTDWGVQLPFLDLMKTARPWIGHRPGQWGGMEVDALRAAGLLDDHGWPREKPGSLSSIGTLILTDLPEDAAGAAGSYLLRFDGRGVVEVGGRAQNVRYGPGEVRFDYAPGPGPVDIRIQRSTADDPVRAITVVRADRAEAFDGGAVFNPDWLALLDGFTVLRFMDWMATNNSTLSHWNDRPRPQDYTFAEKGVPVEILLRLANTLQADPWFTLPHLADDAHVRAFAEAVADGLDPGRRAYLEYSNEVWNWQFAQAAWADEQAQARWNVRDAWVQYHGMRAAEVARIASAVLPADRLVNVIATQTGWLGLEEQILTAPLVVAEGGEPPATAFDAYAVTGYFGGSLGTDERAGLLRDWLADSAARADDPAARFDHASTLAAQELRDGAVTGEGSDSLTDLLDRVLPHHRQVADTHGLSLIMYEGGTHLTGLGPVTDDAALTDFFVHFNYTPEMGALYGRLIDGWHDLGGSLFNAYNDVYAPGKWGSWGALRHLGDDNPRWRALTAAR